MLKRALIAGFTRKPASALGVFQFNQQREIHSRNKKAMEFVAKGWSALKEVDRVIDHCELNDRRLIPLLRTAKENFELALEADNSNTHARYWLGRLHLRYHVPGQNKAIGAALLVEAAEMGDPDAQYELGCQLRVENEYVQSDQKAFDYLERAVDQLHPGALYLLGAVYLSGDCVKKDVASALWCFHRASQKGHAGAAIAYGSLLLKGGNWDLEEPLSYVWMVDEREDWENGMIHVLMVEKNYPSGVEVPESLTKFSLKRGSAARRANKSAENEAVNPVEMAREKFQIAAKAGCDLGFRWLDRLGEEEKRLLSETQSE